MKPLFKILTKKFTISIQIQFHVFFGQKFQQAYKRIIAALKKNLNYVA